MCASIFYTKFVRNISQSKKQWASYDKKMYIGFHVTYRYACQISMKLEYSRHFFFKNAQILYLMKIRLVGDELLHADGQT